MSLDTDLATAAENLKSGLTFQSGTSILTSPLSIVGDFGTFLAGRLMAPEAAALVPDELSRFATIQLTEFEIQGKVVTFALRATAGSGGAWTLVPSLVEVNQISGSFAIDPDAMGPKLSGDLSTSITIAGFQVTAAIAVPDRIIVATLTSPGAAKLGVLFRALDVDGHGLENLRLSTVRFTGSVYSGYLGLEVTVSDLWHLGTSGLTFDVDQIDLSVVYLTGEDGGVTGSLSAQAKLDAAGSSSPIVFKVSASCLGAGAGWTLTGSIANFNVSRILEKFGVHQSPFDDLIVELVEIEFNTASGNFHFSFKGSFSTVSNLPAEMIADVRLVRQPDKTYQKHFSASLEVGPAKFDLVFDQTGSSRDFIGLYQNPGSAGLSVLDVLSPVIAVPAALNPLNLKIKDALFAYQSSASNQPSGKDVSGKFLFAIDTDLSIDLSGLARVPLVGAALPAGETLDLAFEVLVHSDGFDAGASFRSLLPSGAPLIPDNLPGQFQLLTTLRFGDITKQLDLGLETDDIGASPSAAPPGAAPAPSQSPALPATPPASKADPDKLRKTDVQKHFGPLNIESVAVAFDKSAQTIAILLSGSLSVTGLDLALDGLAGTYNLATREITFGLKGLSIDFKRGELEVGGGFLNVDGDFAGKVIIKTKTFSIAALGAVAITEGQPSIFIYGFLNYPLGGPAFFYVEGLAAGFGYNRGFIPPAIGDVRSFPLVEDAAKLAAGATLSTKPKTKDEITNQLTRLHDFIPPSTGEYFFSAGIKFTSFKLLNSFLLVTVVAGERFEIDVLGVSTYQNPPIAVEGVPSLAHIELNVVGRIAPDEGFAGIQAQLTDASYIYSSLCKLAGGFAFFTWFAPSPLAGDFVLSVGGYHPAFSKPAHYPDVPRLSLAYQITEDIFVKGSAYFALTPTMLMAGAALEARVTLGSLEAWFNASLDFMIGWEPYHYQASLNVSIGARWTIFETELNAQLDIWGPEFSGFARVHWTVFSFDVSFGGPRAGPSPIAWDRFRDQFLESKADRDADKKLLFIRVLGGAVGSVKKGTEEMTVVNPAQFLLETSSPIPARTASVNNVAGNPDFTVSRFGIAPMDMDDSKLSESSHAVEIKRSTGTTALNLTVAPVKQMFPPGLWHTAMTVPADAPMVSAIGGFTLAAPAAVLVTPVGVKRSDLDFSAPVATPVKTVPAPVSYTRAAALAQIALQSSFESAAAARADILRALGLEPVTLIAISPSLADAFDTPPEVVSA